MDNQILAALQQEQGSLIELHREIHVTESKTGSELITKIKVVQNKRPHISRGRKTWCSVTSGKSSPKNDSLALSFVFELSHFHFY